MANEIQKREMAGSDPRQRYKQEVDKRINLLKPLLGDITPEQATALLYQAAATTPDLLLCTPASIVRGIATCVQLGLMPGPKGHIYLIPRKNKKAGVTECTVQAGYKGYIHLALKSGVTTYASVAYRQDRFSVTEGEYLCIEHIPNIDHDAQDSDIVAAYAFATLPDGSKVGAWMRRSELEATRARAAADNGPWSTDVARMCRKSAIRRLFQGGTVPMSDEMSRLIEAEMEDEAIEVKPERTMSALDRAAGILPEPTPEVAIDPVAQFRAELADCPDIDTVYAVRDQWAHQFSESAEWSDMLAAIHARLEALK